MVEQREQWTMPEWMEPYRPFINNTGGNSVEDLVNMPTDQANVATNVVLALLCVAVKSQVGLLESLHKQGLLK